MFLFCSFLLHSPISLSARTSLIASPTWNYPVPKLSLRFSELAASNTLVSWRIAADIASTIIAAVHFMVIRLVGAASLCPVPIHDHIARRLHGRCRKHTPVWALWARSLSGLCWRRACLRYLPSQVNVPIR